MSRQSRKTADELMSELEQKPEFVARQEARMAEREENRRRYADAARRLLEELRAAGFTVSTLAELRQRGVGDRRALPVLVKWLPMVTYLPLKEDLIATLGSRWARPAAARPLLEEFRRIDPETDPPGGVRWSIGDALERVADDSVADDLLEIARDRVHGSQRGLVVAALGNLKTNREQVVPLLIELLSDDDVVGYAAMALGKLRAIEARAALDKLHGHPKTWVRKEAKNALAKLR